MVPFSPFSPQWWAAQAAATGGQSSVSTQGPSQASFPLVSPVVDDCPPRQEFFNGQGAITNSLVLQGLITRTGQGTFASHSTVYRETRNPTTGDDATRGYWPGHRWFNTVNNFYFFCYDATPGQAKWAGIPAYPYDSTVPSSPGTSVITSSQPPNLALLSPSGAAGLPSFRSILAADLPSTVVYSTRTINTTTPLAGGGDLSADRTLSVGGLSTMGTANYFLVSNGMTWQYNQLAVGTSGTDFDISHSGTTTTFNLPNASATARGLVSTGTQTIAGDKTLTGATTISGTTIISGQVSFTSSSSFVSYSGITSWSSTGPGTYRASLSNNGSSAGGTLQFTSGGALGTPETTIGFQTAAGTIEVTRGTGPSGANIYINGAGGDYLNLKSDGIELSENGGAAKTGQTTTLAPGETGTFTFGLLTSKSGSAASYVSDGATLSTGLTFPNAGLKVKDTDASHALIFKPGSNITADRTLTLTTGDADRTVTVQGDVTLPAGTALVNGGALGTPSSGTLTNCTGLPVTGLGALNALTNAAPAVDDVVPIYDASAAANRDTTVQEILGLMRGHIDGLTLSNNGSDANNDIDIAVGVAVDSTGVRLMTLASALTKRLDASWAVGTNQGGLDTGAEANSTWYHVWLIQRSDTGVVDVLFSTSATAPTMPANYDYKRRIGAIRNNGSGNIIAFKQRGDTFLFAATINDVAATLGTSATSYTLTVPDGVYVKALFYASIILAAQNPGVYVYSPDLTDEAFSVTSNPRINMRTTTNSVADGAELEVHTNTSSQIRAVASNAGCTFGVGTRGWVDPRGRND